MPELLSFLAQYWPERISLAIFLYAFVALLTTTTLLTTRIVRTRLRLRNVRTRDHLIGAFSQSGLEHLLTRILDLAPSEVSGGRIVIQSPFSASRARREVAHLYTGRLARLHFLTAVTALLTVSVLSWMQDYGGIPIWGITLPPLLLTGAAALTLAIFGSLGHLTVNAATTWLLDKIAEIPAERIETAWLRMLATVLERVGSGRAPALENDFMARIQQLLERLNATIDRNSRSLHDSVLQLSATVEAFTETVNPFSESPASMQAPGFENLAQLNAAIDRLTTKLDRLSAAPWPPSVPSRPDGADIDAQVSPRPNSEIKQQLRDLMKEFD